MEMIKHTSADAESPFLSDLVIGMSDGLIVPLALTVGLSRVTDSAATIASIGIVALTAGAIAMGMGGYLTARSEKDLFTPEHAATGHHVPVGTGNDIEEVRAFLAGLGLSEELQAKAAEEWTKEKKDWSALLKDVESPATQQQRATKMGLNIGVSYALGGCIPVMPYFFTDTATAFNISLALAILVLPTLGYLKSRVTGLSPLAGILRTTITGLLAATGAFIVANIFSS